MRFLCSFCGLLLVNTSIAQIKDTRAELDIYGGVEKINVSPNERIWLVTKVGNTYYTNNIDSTWHYGMTNTNKGDYSVDGPLLDRISFFNNDTAIISGYMQYGDTYNRRGYFLTENGGKNWEARDYGGESWIYDAFASTNGKAWMGGLSKEVYYSTDFGRTWKTIKMPYKSTDRTYSIFMKNDSEGVAGSDRDEILVTKDNWNSAKNIESPYSQTKYSKYGDGRIYKVRIWKNYLVVDQEHHIYYSTMDEIKWREFPIEINEFEVDVNSDKLFAVSNDLRVITFLAPSDFTTLNKKALERKPMDIQIVNGSFYAIEGGNDIYKITSDSYKKITPYTRDHKIADVNNVTKGKTLTWGAKGNQLYLSEDGGNNWYRENVLKFGIANIKLLSDSEAILWDGFKNNYRYFLATNSYSKFSYVKPIEDFLFSPIEKIIVIANSSGCFHNYNNRVEYSRKDSVLTTKNFTIENHDSKKKPFRNQISYKELSGVMEALNNNPYYVPSAMAFKFTQKDKDDYIRLVNKLENETREDLPGQSPKITDKAFYLSAINALDTISSPTIEAILDQPERWMSTTSNHFWVEIINAKGDTLIATRNYYVKTLPGNLPWNFEYKGTNFNSYDIRFSQLVNACIPDEFMDKQAFNNSLMILEIADYLSKKSTVTKR